MSKRLRWAAALLSSFALLAGALVYLLARPDSAFALAGALAYPAWTGSVPSLLHTLGFALLCAACAASVPRAVGLALVWGAIELSAELLQLRAAPVFAGFTFDWTFDALDLAAIVAGTALAVAVILTQPDIYKR